MVESRDDLWILNSFTRDRDWLAPKRESRLVWPHMKEDNRVVFLGEDVSAVKAEIIKPIDLMPNDKIGHIRVTSKIAGDVGQVSFNIAVRNLAEDDGCDELDVYDAKLTRAGRREAQDHATAVLDLIRGRAGQEVVVLCSPLRRCLTLIPSSHSSNRASRDCSSSPHRTNAARVTRSPI